MKKVKSGSPALDLAMKLMFDFPNEIVNEKTITIKITERRGCVDYLVTDTSKIPDTKLESQIWHSIQKVIEKKYKIHPNSWEKKRID
tara:strand:- start:70 stop:330 length:261 start_codon:yes stop_codon:yes gene_type:complete